MNIRAIRLQNFRGFQDAHIELKPLTVLLGPNSSGKSSFGQALAAMAHAHKLYVSTPQASLTPPSQDIDGWPVDLGKTDDLRTKGAEGPVKIGLQTNGGWVELGFGGLTHTSDLLMSCISHPSGEQSASKTPSNMVLGSVPEGQTSGVVLVEGASHERHSTGELRQSIVVKKVNEGQWQEEGGTEVSIILDGLLLKAVQHTTGTARLLSGAARDDLHLFLKHLTYLRASRKRPSRGYTPGVGKQQPIGYSGEWTPSILLENGQDRVTYLVPPAIHQGVDGQEPDYRWATKQETLGKALDVWLTHLELAGHVEIVPPSPGNNTVEMRVALVGQSARDVTEIGFGISQVVPVLVSGLLQTEHSLLVVDLPEAHLHPRPQGAIADFFCSLALSGRSALIETHSEMFFHRLRLRAAQNPSLMDKIAVYFIDAPKDGHCSPPRPVGLGFTDELRWPKGFLQEGWETEMQINVVRQAREPS